MKKLLIYAALAFAGYKLYSKKKAIDNIKEFLTVTPQNIRNIKLIKNGVEMRIDVKLTNDSPYDFSMYGLGLVKLTKIYFHTSDGHVFATAYPNISNITIEPFSNTILPAVQTTAGFSNLSHTIFELVLKPNNFRTTAELEIFGYKYIIENP